MSAIVWLASYPKSGNTWLGRCWRITGAATDSPSTSTSSMKATSPAAVHFSTCFSVESSDRPPLNSSASARPSFATQREPPRDAAAQDSPMPTPSPTQARRGCRGRHARRALHRPQSARRGGVVRTPTCRSPIDVAIERMAQPEATLANKTSCFGYPGTPEAAHVSEHVISWIEQTDVPVHLMRYEEMLPIRWSLWCSGAASIGWEHDAARLERAVRLSISKRSGAGARTTNFQRKAAR